MIDLEKPFLIGYSPLGEDCYVQITQNRQFTRWHRSHLIAALNWITKYESDYVDSKLVLVKGRLEAFYHYSQTEDWFAALAIWGCCIDKNSGVEFQLQIQMWGYYQQSIALNSTLIGKISPELDAVLTSSMTNIYQKTSQYQTSLDFALQALDMYTRLEDHSGIASALLSTGSIYYAFGKTQKAIEKHLQALEIDEKLNDESGIIHCLTALGEDYRSLGDLDTAKSFLERALDMINFFKGSEIEALVLVNLGSVHLELK